MPLLEKYNTRGWIHADATEVRYFFGHECSLALLLVYVGSDYSFFF